MTETTTPPVRIWIAAFLAAQQEIAVRDRLTLNGYVPLLPTAATETRHARQTLLVNRPVFPRYIFIGVPDGVSWYPLKAMPGVLGVLSVNHSPRIVPDHTLALLREAEEVGAFREMALEHGSPELRAFVRRLMGTLPGQRIGLVYNTSRRELRRMAEVETAMAA